MDLCVSATLTARLVLVCMVVGAGGCSDSGKDSESSSASTADTSADDALAGDASKDRASTDAATAVAADASSGGVAPDAGAPTCDEADGEVPTDVFCIGLYEDRDPHKVSADVMPYKPGVLLWSDGAQKQRYLYLPPDTRIDTSDMDAWKFPVGTKVFKEFRLDGALVETRMLWKRAEHDWAAVTYI